MVLCLPSLFPGAVDNLNQEGGETHIAGPVYTWDPLFSESDAVLKAVREGNRILKRHWER